MFIVITQPQDNYFLWQLRVQMFNFREHGVEQDAIILLGYRGRISDEAKKFASETAANVIFYEDTRSYPLTYHASIIPHMMKKYFKDYSLDRFLYIGDDCLFVKKPNYPTGDKVYWSRGFSLSSHYIKSRSEGLFLHMCLDADVDHKVIEANDMNCGGAQHLFNIAPKVEFWEEMERVGDKLFMRVSAYNARQTDKTKRVQAWTAGMWAMMWGLWKRGIETEVSNEMDHSWPSYTIDKLEKFNFFHNSGVTEKSAGHLFFKGKYRDKAPDNVDFVHPGYCSRWYADQIKKALTL